MKVLLIEDNPIHAELIERILTKEFTPFEFSKALNPALALPLIEKRHFDLILSECVFAGHKEFRFLLRLNKTLTNTAIVVVTTFGDELAATRFIKAGIKDYVVKNKNSLSSLPQTLRSVLKENERKKLKSDRSLRPVPLYHDGFKKLIREVESIGHKVKSLRFKRRVSHPPSYQIDRLLNQVETLSKLVKKNFTSPRP